MDNPQSRSKRKREGSLNVEEPTIVHKKRSTEATQTGTLSYVDRANIDDPGGVVDSEDSDPDAPMEKTGKPLTSPSKVMATFEKVKMKANRDININISGGDLAVQESTAILAELKTLLKPVEAAYDSYASSKNQRSRCFEGTRVQLLKDIRNWATGDDGHAPVYFLDGVAGIGKTTVAQTIAEMLAKDGLLGASFFFSRDEDERKIARYFFPTLAFHLACYGESFATRILDALKDHPDATQKTLQQQISLLIVKPLQDLLNQHDLPIIIVVDALDECDAQEAKTLLTLLSQHVRLLPRLRIFITARPEIHIRDVLDQDHNHERFHLHDIEDVVVEADIRLFLDFCLSVEEVRKRLPRMDPPWQPTIQERRILLGLCGKLFIIASTATKFILDTKRCDPEKQLGRLLEGVSAIDFTGATRTDAMDRFYMQILRSAMPEDYEEEDDNDDWIERYQTVLGAVITLQSPLPSKVLGTLLGLDSNHIEGALEHLHSLVAPSGQSVVFRVHHKSFPDFITSEARIRQALGMKEPVASAQHVDVGLRFRIDACHHHSEMGNRCLKIMEHQLRRNIRNVGPMQSYLDNTELEDISISEELIYASLHWASHIHAGELRDEDARLRLYGWATRHLLSWLELLSIIGRFEVAYSGLEKARRAVMGASDWTDKSHLHELFNDAYRFIRKDDNVIQLSALHMYRSAIPFVPPDTALFKLYGKEQGLRVVSGIERIWDATLATLLGHENWVNSVVFSNDGFRLASASHDHSILMWDAVTGAHITTLDGHQNLVTALAFSSNGWRLASASHDNTACIWDGITGTHIVTLKHSSAVTSVAFSSDGLTLASASGVKVHLWNGKNGVPLNTIDCSSEVTAVAFSGDGSRFALACLGGDEGLCIQLYSWDNKGFLPILVNSMKNSEKVPFITFSNDSSRLASASHDGIIQIWNAKTGTFIRTLQAEENQEEASAVNCISFSAGGLRLASASDDKDIHIWNHQTGSHIAALSGHSDCVTSVAYSPDSTRIASCSGDSTVRIWDAQAVTHIENLHTHSETVTSITFSPDGQLFASASHDGKVNLWNGRTGDHIDTFETEEDPAPINAVSFSNDGSRLAWASVEDNVYLWDTSTSQCIETLNGHEGEVNSIAFSPNNSRLATGGDDGTIRIWDSQMGEEIDVLKAHDSQVTCVRFSPDGLWLASASYDNTVRLYKLDSGAFHEDDVTTLEGHDDWVTSITFSLDSTKIASVSNDNTIRLWDVASGTNLSQYSNDAYQLLLPIFSMKESSSNSDMFILVQRYEPSLSGLVHVRLRHPSDSSSSEYEWQETPFCWFPPDLELSTFAINGDSSLLAVGCVNGRVVLLDITRVSLPPI